MSSGSSSGVIIDPMNDPGMLRMRTNSNDMMTSRVR
jgi:hypothetical protein